jgi:dihydrofolate synthase/folylpolyglutamate synthase
MNYIETVDFLYSQLPMYQREGSSAYKPDIGNIEALCRNLDRPELKFKSIHVAGTNGKGSVSHMLASIFQASGYQTGLYTSPHLKDFRERIKINGEMIPENEVVDFVENNKSLFDQIKPSFFEMTVAMAFYYFAKEKVDIAVIEVGLGGRLDSTNIIKPILSVITNISFDHTQLLGNSMEAIAFEKAGIIKTGIPVVIGETHPQTKPVFEKAAIQKNAPIYFADEHYATKESEIKEPEFLTLNVVKENKLIYKDIELDLNGAYQRKNILTVIQSVEILKNEFLLSELSIRSALKSVVSTTKLFGRWHVISKKPMIVADTAHNEAGIREVIKQVDSYKFKHLSIVFGAVNDKNLDLVFKELPVSARYYFTKANIPRAMNEKILSEKASEFGLRGFTFQTSKQAVDAAIETAGQDDFILITGSTFIVAECIS